MSEHQTMSRAVHGFHPPLGSLHIKGEHTVLVVHRMSRDLPQIHVEDVRCDHLFVPPAPVLIANELDQSIVHSSSVRHPETATRR